MKRPSSSKRFIFQLYALVIATSVTTALLLVGCENDEEIQDLNTADNVGALSISPQSVTLTLEDTHTVLTANGGTAPFQWSVSDSSMGTVPSSGANVVTYTRETDANGANQVTVVDAQKWSASAVVIQNSDTNSARLK